MNSLRAPSWEHGEDGTWMQFHCVLSIKLWMISKEVKCIHDSKERVESEKKEYGSKGRAKRDGGREREKKRNWLNPNIE